LPFSSLLQLKIVNKEIMNNRLCSKAILNTDENYTCVFRFREHNYIRSAFKKESHCHLENNYRKG
jgi:hypothetical protein